MSRVDIGFSEDCEPWQVESRLFPSKIGGKPAWLSLENIPNGKDIECGICNKPMIFLCQVYAPYEEDDNNFHRTLFVFICRNNPCCKRNSSSNVKVLRSTLKRRNNFYPYDPPEDKPDPDFSLTKWLKLCELCGGPASNHCASCKTTAYCCRDHQVKHWKESHKDLCQKSIGDTKLSRFLFSETELVIEPEEINAENIEVNEEEELEKYKQLESEGKTGTMQDVSESDLDAHTAITTDKAFTTFRKRISHFPDQVLRYERGGMPLWIAENPVPEDIPKCEYCGGDRQFEFQIMPQMLTVLKETAIDWGVLAIYTCKDSCSTNDCYKNEFVFKQDVSDH